MLLLIHAYTYVYVYKYILYVCVLSYVCMSVLMYSYTITWSNGFSRKLVVDNPARLRARVKIRVNVQVFK